MKKLLVGAMTVGLLVGGAGFAQAASQPHQPQDFGLCHAVQGPGNHNGWYKDGHSVPPPFQDLMNRADDGNSNTTDDLATYCGSATPGNK